MTQHHSRGPGNLPALAFQFQVASVQAPEGEALALRDVARVHQVFGATGIERDVAWRKILSAAKMAGVVAHDTSWRDITRNKYGGLTAFV